VKAGGKGGGRNALPSMRFHYFYHLYRLFSPVRRRKHHGEFSGFAPEISALAFSHSAPEKDGKGGEIGEDPCRV